MFQQANDLLVVLGDSWRVVYTAPRSNPVRRGVRPRRGDLVSHDGALWGVEMVPLPGVHLRRDARTTTSSHRPFVDRCELLMTQLHPSSARGILKSRRMNPIPSFFGAMAAKSILDPAEKARREREKANRALEREQEETARQMEKAQRAELPSLQSCV